jgi:hypothetical protein
MAWKFRALVCLLVVVGIGAGVPLVERWMKCRLPMSEACVWAKAYLSLSFALWAVAGLLAAFVTWVLLGRRPDK